MTWELPAFLALVTMFVLAGRAAWILATFRGRRVIACPENRRAAAVTVDRWAALRMLYEPAHLRLANCSRWPEKAGCDQQCLAEIERDPRASRVDELMASWYAGKACVSAD